MRVGQVDIKKLADTRLRKCIFLQLGEINTSSDLTDLTSSDPVDCLPDAENVIRFRIAVFSFTTVAEGGTGLSRAERNRGIVILAAWPHQQLSGGMMSVDHCAQRAREE